MNLFAELSEYAQAYIAGLPVGQWISAVIATLVVLASIMVLLRHRKLREKYAALWLVVGCAMLGVALYPPLLMGLAELLGIAVPTNLLFFSAIMMQLGVLIHLSCETSKLEEETRTLAESVALLRHDLDELRTAQAETQRTTSSAAQPPSPQAEPQRQ